MSMEYHKINSIFKRDPSGKNILWDEYAQPEFEYLADNDWVFTEKVDGTNIRVMWDGEKVTFGGKTDRAQIPANLYSHLGDLFSPADLAALDAYPICLYGEGYGAGIQKGGGRYAPSPRFVLFDVRVSADRDWWLKRADVEDIGEKLGLLVVPVVGHGTLAEMVEKCRSGFLSEWGQFPAEGIVARPAVELQDRGGRRIITKFKLRDFGPAALAAAEEER